ncbi:hypothetical protein P7F60_12140 [Rhizobium sp. YJ-22]|uniref:hypothetical protein n=1 Tax=Rhizobium sp. YJ-22 TaxID=3037556 RepID=UPI0024128AF3|nr:hypothetical protein [Rhizobium sp. YJ-22]MDG3577143.1 hypothetical protein [Rhizobium sp. YJ-22]
MMLTKRRGFLGLFAGAAAAGPGAIRSGAQMALSSGKAVPMPSFNVRHHESVGGFDRVAYVKKQIADTKRWLTGELTDEEKFTIEHERLFHRRHLAEANISALRSVSESRKTGMLMARQRQIDHDRMRHEKEMDIVRWLKELGA